MLVRGPMREKRFDQLFVGGNQISANDLQRRLVGIRRRGYGFFDLTNPFANVHLELAVAVGMFLGVGVLLLESLKRRAHIIAVFFKNGVDSVVVASLSRATRFIKLRVSELNEQLGFANGVCLAVELLLQVRGALRRHRKRREHDNASARK